MAGKGTIIKLLLFIVMLLLIIILLIKWYYRPRYVKLDLVFSNTNPNIGINDNKRDFESEFHWWFLDSKNKIEDIKKQQ
jgi:hypothetical protein